LDKIIIKTVIRRFFEFFFWEIILSVIITALATAEGNATTKLISVGLSFAGIFIYAFINVLFQRRCCFDLADKNLYYKTNYIAYLMFVFINMICILILDGTTYAWMFSLTRAMRYLYIVVPNVVSALIFHGVMLLAIYISPYGMDRILHTVNNDADVEDFLYEYEDDVYAEDEEEEEMFNIPEDRRIIIE
jgi:hypothetical protein